MRSVEPRRLGPGSNDVWKLDARHFLDVGWAMAGARRHDRSQGAPQRMSSDLAWGGPCKSCLMPCAGAGKELLARALGCALTSSAGCSGQTGCLERRPRVAATCRRPFCPMRPVQVPSGELGQSLLPLARRLQPLGIGKEMAELTRDLRAMDKRGRSKIGSTTCASSLGMRRTCEPCGSRAGGNTN